MGYKKQYEGLCPPTRVYHKLVGFDGGHDDKPLDFGFWRCLIFRQTVQAKSYRDSQILRWLGVTILGSRRPTLQSCQSGRRTDLDRLGQTWWYGKYNCRLSCLSCLQPFHLEALWLFKARQTLGFVRGFVLPLSSLYFSPLRIGQLLASVWSPLVRNNDCLCVCLFFWDA